MFVGPEPGMPAFVNVVAVELNEVKPFEQTFSVLNVVP